MERISAAILNFIRRSYESNFLDIDGVLNSHQFDLQRDANDGNIDETRLPLLAEITEITKAKIVLSSSWRKHWSKTTDMRDAVGRELDEVFERYGLEIFDRTPILLSNDRFAEIEYWLSENNDVENFVILDDIRSGWGNFDARVVKTNYRIGRGLEQHHVEMAIEILTIDSFLLE